MRELVPILVGSLFTLSTAYAFGGLVLRSIPAPRSLRFVCGAAILSLIVFFLFLVGAGNVFAFSAVGIAAIAGAILTRRRETARTGAKQESLFAGVDRVTAALTGLVFAAYGVLYFVHALAPEIQPDAAGYHLGLVAESLRLGSFPSRVGFYEVLPQGPEMLFAFAFAVGRHSAAKLVHLCLLAMTAPLIMATGRRLQLPPWVPAAASVFYICAPVVGVTGTSAYTDAALVLAIVATFYSLLAWTEDRAPAWLAAAGVCAGFCYSAKIPALIVTALAVSFVLVKTRSWKPAAALAGWAALVIAPWMLRAWAMSGNPVAPLLNRFFPNPFFHLQTEVDIANWMHSYGGVSYAQAPFEWILSGLKLNGLIGPLFLLTPVGLLALRRRQGRVLWAAAVLMSAFWILNIGTRFLMPTLPFLALALALAVPRPLAWGMVALHAASCWPQAIDVWNKQPYVWRLRGFPIKAALRLEPEDAYLNRNSPGYAVARMLDGNVPVGERVLGITGHAMAYRSTDATLYWHTAAGDRVYRALAMAQNRSAPSLVEFSAQWPECELAELRIEQPASGPSAWSVHEVRPLRGPDEIQPSWATASPNPWEAGYAFDRNPLSRWSSWAPMRSGMTLEAQFSPSAILTGATVVVDAASADSPPRFYGRGKERKWKALGGAGSVRMVPAQDLRWAAVRLMKREGFRWILVQSSASPMEQALAEESAAWELEKKAQFGDVYLLRAE